MPLLGIFTIGICGEDENDWIVRNDSNLYHVNEVMLIIQDEVPKEDWFNMYDLLYCESGLRPFPYINARARGDSGSSHGSAQIKPKFWKSYIYENESLDNVRDAIRITMRIVNDDKRSWQKGWKPWACRPGTRYSKAAQYHGWRK